MPSEKNAERTIRILQCCLTRSCKTNVIETARLHTALFEQMIEPLKALDLVREEIVHVPVRSSRLSGLTRYRLYIYYKTTSKGYNLLKRSLPIQDVAQCHMVQHNTTLR